MATIEISDQYGRMETHATSAIDSAAVLTRNVAAIDSLGTGQPVVAASVLDELRSTAMVSVGRTAEILGISRGHAYNLVKSGDLPVIRLGAKRVRVPSVALLRMLAGE